MRRTVSLSEFMPYGAPELLAARRPHLALALTISSALAVLLFAIALKIVPIGPIDLPRLDPPINPHYVNPPPPPFEVIDDLRPPIAPVVKSNAGTVVPVDDRVKPADWTEIPPVSSGDGHGEGPIDIANPGTSSGTTTPERLPNLGDYVPVDELPEPVREYKPPYPEFAKDAGVEGLVIVHALIGIDGHVLRVQLDPKYSIPMLNETALDAAKKWVFKPAYANGHPVAVWFAIPYRFVLHE
jgi:periplasmic protein TonB